MVRAAAESRRKERWAGRSSVERFSISGSDNIVVRIYKVDVWKSKSCEPKCNHMLLWAMAWLSKLVSLRCRCCRTAKGTEQRRSELERFSRLWGPRRRWGNGGDLRIRPGGHIPSLGDLAKRPRYNLPAATPMGVYDTKRKLVGNRTRIVACG